MHIKQYQIRQYRSAHLQCLLTARGHEDFALFPKQLMECQDIDPLIINQKQFGFLARNFLPSLHQ
jgi:hypothetical protein